MTLCLLSQSKQQRTLFSKTTAREESIEGIFTSPSNSVVAGEAIIPTTLFILQEFSKD